MKFLKYFLGIIALLVLVFILIGFIKPEVSYDCEVIVDKEIEEAWSVAQDEEKMADWMDGFQRYEPVSGTPGTVGAVSNVHFITDGEEMTIKETIKGIKLNESMEMLFETDFMNMDYVIKMEPFEGKTKISSSTTAKGNGMFSKFFMPLISSTMINQEETNLSNLKKTIEANQKNYFPEEEVTGRRGE